MGRKVFKEKGITAAGNVLPLDTFVPFTGRGPGQPEGLYIHPAPASSVTSGLPSSKTNARL